MHETRPTPTPSRSARQPEQRAGTVVCYRPGRRFVAISITGTECALHCRHCNGHYLRGMIGASTPDRLRSWWSKQRPRQSSAGHRILGCLLSGGCDANGRVPHDKYLAIYRLLCDRGLLLNAHLGLASEWDRADLRALLTVVDTIAVDLPASAAVIRAVYALDRERCDWDEGLHAVHWLVRQAPERVVPHLCLGLIPGPKGAPAERTAIKALAARHPHPARLVLIGFIPTRNTALADQEPPTAGQFEAAIRTANQALPTTDIVLGCMRDRRTPAIETAAIRAGATGIVNPSRSTITALEAEGYTFVDQPTCCAIPAGMLPTDDTLNTLSNRVTKNSDRTTEHHPSEQ